MADRQQQQSLTLAQQNPQRFLRIRRHSSLTHATLEKDSTEERKHEEKHLDEVDIIAIKESKRLQTTNLKRRQR